MSEGTPRILRPGSSISYAARSNMRTPRHLSGAKTSLGQNVRQIFPSPRDSAAITNFKGTYQSLMNCVASFLSHNNTTTEFRVVFNQIIKIMDENMNKFLLATPRFQSENIDSKTEKMFLKRFMPFLRNFWDFSCYIKQMRESGSNPIHEAIDMHFQIITDGIDAVKNSSVSSTGIHDPIVRRAKALQSQMMNLKRISIDTVQYCKDSTRITTELRSFSRLLNNAFSIEFAASPIGPTNLEKIRSECYTSCCSIIHSIREANLFKEHSMAMFIAYDNFKATIEVLLEKNGIESKIGELCGEEEESEETVIRFDKNLSLTELIAKGREAFYEEKFQDFFELLEISANNVLSENETLKGKIENYKNIKRDRKKAEIERDAARKLQNEIQKENEELKIMMNENNRKMAEYDKNAGCDTQYKDTIVEVIPLIATYLHEDIHNPTLDKSIISYFKNLMNGIFTQKCQRCVQFMKKEMQIQDLIESYVETKPDLVESIQDLLKILVSDKRVIKVRTQEVTKLNQQIGIMRDGYSNILSLFNIPHNKTVDVAQFTYQTVKEEIEKQKEATETLLNQKSEAQQEFVANLIKRFKLILDMEETTSIEDYLFKIETKIGELSQRDINNNLYLNNLSNKLHSIMHTIKDNTIPIEDGIMTIAEKIECYVKELEEKESKPNEEPVQEVEKPDYTEIGEKLNKILQIQGNTDTKSQILTKIDSINNTMYESKKKYNNVIKEKKQLKDCILDVVKALNEYVNNEVRDFTDNNNEIIEIAKDLISKLKNKKPDITKEDITRMFEPIMNTLQVTTKEDPFTFIPEFVDEYQLLSNSVTSLKPFATILNNIFANFDCNYKSFDPTTQTSQYFKDQVLKLHNTLNQMSSSKTHNLIFLILSRFVTLISSIMSAITVSYTT